MDLDLGGRRAYLTAASGGLGRAVATELVREGANVVVTSRDENNLQEAIDTIGEETGQPNSINYRVCDLTDPDSSRNATRESIRELGGLDILVTNHGGSPTERFSELSLEDFDAAYQNILRSTLQVC